KLKLIYNGIDASAIEALMLPAGEARRRLAISPGALVFTSVANLFTYKGHEDLLHALGHLRDRLSQDWVLLVVGRDVEGNLAKLRRLSEQLGLRRHVFFLGQRLDVPAVLSAANVHISASHQEGFPNNILEAMCAALPVVATNVGGVAELI